MTDNRDLQKVIEIIDKKVNQTIALANHIKNGHVEWNYVNEKSERFPVLDSKNNAVREKIAAILFVEYGVRISEF
jgi:D-hexose-6-phosphate mutarotase